jgi:hypothetical protein
MLVALKGVVVHHSGTRWLPLEDAMESFRRLHVEKRGWREIGYHHVLCPRTGRHLPTGRGLFEYGAHAKGANDTIGICLVGDYIMEEVPSIGIIALTRLLGYMALSMGNRRLRVWSHCEVPGGTTSTDCGTGKLGSLIAELDHIFSGAGDA